MSCSCELRVALIVRVKSCELHLISELQVERKLRIGNSKVRVGPKLRIAYFLLKEMSLSPNKTFFEVAIQFTSLWCELATRILNVSTSGVADGGYL